MSELREALEKLADDWEGYVADSTDMQEVFELSAGKLREILAAHPEPATGVTEQAVEAAARVLKPGAFEEHVYVDPEPIREIYRGEARAALEAALPYMGVRPVVDREAVHQAIADNVWVTADDDGNPTVEIIEAVPAVMDLLTGGGSETTE